MPAQHATCVYFTCTPWWLALAADAQNLRPLVTKQPTADQRSAWTAWSLKGYKWEWQRKGNAEIFDEYTEVRFSNWLESLHRVGYAGMQRLFGEDFLWMSSCTQRKHCIIASDCQVAMIVVIWGSENLYCMSSFTHAASLYVFSAGTAAALSVATVTSMRCGCTLTKHATRDCQVALIVLIWGVAWWSVRKWKWNQICLLWYYCELFGLFNSIECFVISQNGGCWLIASWHGNNSKQSQACKRTEFSINFRQGIQSEGGGWSWRRRRAASWWKAPNTKDTRGQSAKLIHDHIAESKDSNRVLSKFVDLVSQLEHADCFSREESGFDLR